MLKRRHGKIILAAWMMVLPALLIRMSTIVYPFVMTVVNSFQDLNIFKGASGDFIGFANYAKLFTDDKLHASLTFTAIFTLVSMGFHLILGVGLALLLNLQFKGKKLLRTIVLIPWATPMVVVGIAAKYGFNDTYGLINDLIRRIVPNFHFGWLVHGYSARIAVIAVDLWKNVPFFAILILAGLQFISADLYEAARIDGSGSINSFFKITLPLIKRNILTTSIFFTMWRMTSFDVVYAMTSGGPFDSTSLLAYRIYQEAFTNLNLGYASAIAILLFLLMALMSLTNLRFISKIDY